MRYISAVFVFFLGLFIHWLWSTYFPIGGLVPQVLLIMTIGVAARSGPFVGQCYGFAWGLFLDVACAHVFGANALALTLTAYAIGTVRRQMDTESLAPGLLIVAFWTPLYFLFYGVMGRIFEGRFLWPGWVVFLFTPVYNCLFVPFGFGFVRKWIDI